MCTSPTSQGQHQPAELLRLQTSRNAQGGVQPASANPQAAMPSTPQGSCRHEVDRGMRSISWVRLMGLLDPI